jgi:hypothetical protein
MWAGQLGDNIVCLVPCSSDTDCAAGFFCNGVCEASDIGPTGYCFQNL